MVHKIAGVVLLSCLTGAVVLAATPQETLKARHDHYHELGDAFKARPAGVFRGGFVRCIHHKTDLHPHEQAAILVPLQRTCGRGATDQQPHDRQHNKPVFTR